MYKPYSHIVGTRIARYRVVKQFGVGLKVVKPYQAYETGFACARDSSLALENDSARAPRNDR